MDCPACGTQLPQGAKSCSCGWKKPGMSLAVVLLLVVAGFCLLSVPLVAVVAAIAIPNLIEARQAGNEAAAIGAMRTISTSQSLFREADKDGDEVFDYGSLQELSDSQLIDSILGSGTKQGYLYGCTADPQDPEFRWSAWANPAVPGTTGGRYFATNQTGVIWYSKTAPVQLDAQGEPMGDAAVVGR